MTATKENKARAANAASELRRIANTGSEVTLPASSVTVRVKPVSIESLIRKGLVPSHLYSIVLRGAPELDALQESSKPEDIEKFAEMALAADNWTYQTLKMALVEPKIVDEPRDGENEIAYEDLLEEDRHFLVNLLQVPVKEWERFLRESQPSVRDMDDSKEPSA